MKTVTAYIRLWNEEDTIIPCLESIRGIFDEILVLYSNITDGSLQLIEEYKNKEKINNIRIEKYPHKVYTVGVNFNEVPTENGLASYYNYGLKFIKTDLWMKIDADHVYFNDKLKESIDHYKKIEKNFISCFCGINGHIYENKLFVSELEPIQGKCNDHWLLSNTSDVCFQQSSCYEILKWPPFDVFRNFEKPLWFHLRRLKKYNENTIPGIISLNKQAQELYKIYVLPLLEKCNSKYKNLEIII